MPPHPLVPARTPPADGAGFGTRTRLWQELGDVDRCVLGVNWRHRLPVAEEGLRRVTRAGWLAVDLEPAEAWSPSRQSPRQMLAAGPARSRQRPDGYRPGCGSGPGTSSTHSVARRRHERLRCRILGAAAARSALRRWLGSSAARTYVSICWQRVNLHSSGARWAGCGEERPIPQARETCGHLQPDLGEPVALRRPR